MGRRVRAWLRGLSIERFLARRRAAPGWRVQGPIDDKADRPDPPRFGGFICRWGLACDCGACDPAQDSADDTPCFHSRLRSPDKGAGLAQTHDGDNVRNAQKDPAVMLAIELHEACDKLRDIGRLMGDIGTVMPVASMTTRDMYYVSVNAMQALTAQMVVEAQDVMAYDQGWYDGYRQRPMLGNTRHYDLGYSTGAVYRAFVDIWTPPGPAL